jgi:hypothetical protein
MEIQSFNRKAFVTHLCIDSVKTKFFWHIQIQIIMVSFTYPRKQNSLRTFFFLERVVHVCKNGVAVASFTGVLFC